MTRLFLAAALASLFLLFAGCREDASIASSDLIFLQQEINSTTWTEYGTRYTEHLDTLYVNQGEKVLFSAYYALSGRSIPTDSAVNLFDSHYWKIGESITRASSFEYQFDSVGHHLCILHTIDFSGDTLKDTVHIFTGTPLDITLVTPPQQSSVEPLSKDFVELNWVVSGIDPWEKSECTVYAAVAEDIELSRYSRWIDILDSVNFLVANDCKTGVQLKGPLISEKWLEANDIDLKDSSLTIYWGVKARVYTENGFEELSSDVSVFNTLLLAGDSSIIQVKPTYESLVAGTKISTQIVLVSDLGDTLKRITYDNPNEPLSIKVLPQSGLHILAYETKRTDYTVKPVVIDVPERTKIRLTDSFHFTDKIPPKAAPVKTSLVPTDSVRFYFMDDGSGISSSQKKFVIADYDTVNAVYEAPILSFANPCRRECKIRIPISDNARNRNAELFWAFKPDKDSLRITGPFISKEEP